MLGSVGCATHCLGEVDACEGMSIEKIEFLNTYTCKVCLVKAVGSTLKQFTPPSNDTWIYRRVMDMEKGKSTILPDGNLFFLYQ